MKLLVYMGHPAHFYLFKNTIINLRQDGHEVLILIKKKDILEQLLQNQGWEYHNILQEGRKNNKFSILWGTLKRAWRLNTICRTYNPDMLIGTSVENSFIGPLRHIPVINCNEDDASVVPLYAKLSYPGASVILTPRVCNCGKWEQKATKYESYHELAYLHPNHFSPSYEIVKQALSLSKELSKPYFILRFASLHAHHDSGIKGINTEIAKHLIEQLKPHGTIYITSERELEPEFEQYRIQINPLDMHHVLAFASIYIGDSQTMAAEAGVLGVPFVRFNGFVGRIGYLRELEEVYQLGYGVRPENVNQLYERVDELLQMPDRATVFATRRQKMLADKIDYAQYLTDFIEHYPV